jgi:hypothetical protein
MSVVRTGLNMGEPSKSETGEPSINSSLNVIAGQHGFGASGASSGDGWQFTAWWVNHDPSLFKNTEL